MYEIQVNLVREGISLFGHSAKFCSVIRPKPYGNRLTMSVPGMQGGSFPRPPDVRLRRRPFKDEGLLFLPPVLGKESPLPSRLPEGARKRPFGASLLRAGRLAEGAGLNSLNLDK